MTCRAIGTVFFWKQVLVLVQAVPQVVRAVQIQVQV